MHQYLHCKLLEERNFAACFVMGHLIFSRPSIVIDYIKLKSFSTNRKIRVMVLEYVKGWKLDDKNSLKDTRTLNKTKKIL